MFFEGRKYVIFDGALGTMLQKYGLKPGERPDVMNITAPDVVESVHRMYIEAGSDIICANTFGASTFGVSATSKGAHSAGAAPYTVRELIAAAVANAGRARDGYCRMSSGDGGGSGSGGSGDGGAVLREIKIALDIGPTGQLLEPVGDLEYDTAYEIFAEQAVAGEQEGANLVAIETMSDLSELQAAILAVKENTRLPVFATMTFDRNGYTYTGCTPERFTELAGRLGADAVGLNCSLAPAEMYATAERIAGSTELPLIVKPNAGLPTGQTGAYSIGPEEFARQMEWFKNIGVWVVGGCCGTTPEFIREIKKVFG